MAAFNIKLVCILLFVSGINATWPGFPFFPNPLFDQQNGGLQHHRGHFFPRHHGGGGGFPNFHLPNPFDDASAEQDPAPADDPKPDDEPKQDDELKPDDQPKQNAAGPIPDAPPQPAFPTQYKGKWALVKQDAGVSAMQMILLPNNKVLMFDASAFHISNIKLPNGQCVPYKNDKGEQLTDCWSHGVEYDTDANAVRPLKFMTDPWCSSGGLTVDGNFVNTGGWMEGTRSVRWMDTCDKCDFRDFANALAEPRWYATQVTMADGTMFLIGGRKSYSWEFVAPEGQVNKQATFFPLLDETTDLDENNLYPFVHVSSDGNLFIFANDRSVLFDAKNNKVLKEFPKLAGGSRNYPASGMSALLPIELLEQNPQVIPIDVLVCGGAKPEAYGQAGKGIFMPALDDCNRLRITDPNPVWEREVMPSKRVMGDLLNLPTGDLLIINGAQAGASAWALADQPNFTPIIYNPKLPNGKRFFNMQPTNIARMYHSTSALLPNGKILVAGSNTNPGYDYKAKFPTELRVETYEPPYLDPTWDAHRPEIAPHKSDNKLKYGQAFEIEFNLNKEDQITRNDIKVTMIAPPFTTHGYSQNQRLLVLANTELTRGDEEGIYRIKLLSPPTGDIAPPGYYLVFVVHRGVPSAGMWVQIKQ